MLDSYPPLLRQISRKSPDGVDSNVSDETVSSQSDPLPVIDLLSIDLESERKKLSEACKDWGIFRLVNHGIPLTLLSQLHDHVTELFELDFESKQTLFENKPITYFWGTPALTTTGVALQRDHSFNWVEGLNVSLTQIHMLQPQDNPLLLSFRFLLEEYGTHQSRLARTIFEAMVKNLQLCLEETMSYVSPSTSALRLYRYPRRSASSVASDKPIWGMNAHTDSSVISILSQDQVGGLQLYKDNSWLDVKPIPNTLVVHIGDLMQAISDDKYTSVKHRVKAHPHTDRISMGYFVFPEDNHAIKSSKYRPFTYSDFLAQVQQDVKTMGFKVGLKRFKLVEACDQLPE